MDRMPAKSYEDLIVWQKAHQLVLATYRITVSFPREEKYHLAAQLRDAAVSVPANIAEGFRRKTPADKVHFLVMAHGSLSEADYFLRLSKDLGYAETSDLRLLAGDVSKLLFSYRRAIGDNAD